MCERNIPLDLESISKQLFHLRSLLPIPSEESSLYLEYSIPFNEGRCELSFRFTSFVANNSFSLYLKSDGLQLYEFYSESLRGVEFFLINQKLACIYNFQVIM